MKKEKGPAVASILVVLLVISALGCQGRVHVSMTAPDDWEGATIYVDGDETARFRSVDSRDGDSARTSSVATFGVSVGKHLLKIEKSGFHPVIRNVDYAQSGEDYIVITEVPTSVSE